MGKNPVPQGRGIMDTATPALTPVPHNLDQLADYVSRHWPEQLAVVKGAPMPFAVSVAVCALLALVIQWLYFRGTLNTLRERIKLRDEQLAQAPAPEPPKSSPSPASVPAPTTGARDFAKFLAVDELWFARQPKANIKSKLVLNLTNSGNRPIHFLENISWTSQKGDVGLQSDVGFGYWVYPKGSSTWVDSTDPIVQPNERLHVWAGLDEDRPEADLNNRKRAKRLGILRIPVEIDGEKGLVEYRL
jgi:hypothetical protein